jgi:hypothetical protein
LAKTVRHGSKLMIDANEASTAKEAVTRLEAIRRDRRSSGVHSGF